MFFSIKKISVILASLSIALSSHAYIYQIDVWEKRDNSGKVVQELYCMSDLQLYCMSDFHEEMDEYLSQEERAQHIKINRKQRAVLLDQCKKREKSNTLFIIEDPASDITYTKIKIMHPAISKEWRYSRPPINMRDSILSYLADELRKQKHNVINVETRPLRLEALSFSNALLTHMDSELSTCPYTTLPDKPTIQDLIKEFDKSLSRARAFCLTDGPTLKHYYTNILTQVSKAIIPANILGPINTNAPYHEFIDDSCHHCSPTYPITQWIKAEWGWEILTINALHSIYQAPPSIDKICVIMEGIRVSEISTVLPALGYTKIKTIGKSPLTQDEMRKLASFFSEYHYTMFNYLFTKNTVARDILYDNTDKWKQDLKLAQRLAHAKPINNTDFNVITERKNKRAKKGMFSFTLV